MNKMNVNINDAEDMKCPECENEYFKPVFRVKRISAFISPSGEETMIPVQLLACTKCDHVVSDIE